MPQQPHQVSRRRFLTTTAGVGALACVPELLKANVPLAQTVVEQGGQTEHGFGDKDHLRCFSFERVGLAFDAPAATADGPWEGSLGNETCLHATGRNVTFNLHRSEPHIRVDMGRIWAPLHGFNRMLLGDVSRWMKSWQDPAMALAQERKHGPMIWDLMQEEDAKLLTACSPAYVPARNFLVQPLQRDGNARWVSMLGMGPFEIRNPIWVQFPWQTEAVKEVAGSARTRARQLQWTCSSIEPCAPNEACDWGGD